MKTYVTFGQVHVHRISGVVYDKDCVAVVNGDRSAVVELFGDKFFTTYTPEQWDEDNMKYFPRGFIQVGD